MKERMTRREVAEMYGVTEDTVGHWIRSKYLPAVKVGKRYLVRAEDIKRFEDWNCTIKDEGKA